MRVPEFSLSDLRSLVSDMEREGVDTSLISIVLLNVDATASDGDDISPLLSRMAHDIGDGSVLGDSPAAGALKSLLVRFDPGAIHATNRQQMVHAEQHRQEQENAELFDSGELRLSLGAPDADAQAERIVDRFFGRKVNA